MRAQDPKKDEEITVIFTDKKQGYKPIGTGTYPVEEYVAGVIYGELNTNTLNEDLYVYNLKNDQNILLEKLYFNYI